VLCCIQFSHAEFTQIYLHYDYAAPLASSCAPTSHDVHKGGRVVKQVLYNLRGSQFCYSTLYGEEDSQK